VSKAIADLEHALGVRLPDRSRRGRARDRQRAGGREPIRVGTTSARPPGLFDPGLLDMTLKPPCRTTVRPTALVRRDLPIVVCPGTTKGWVDPLWTIREFTRGSITESDTPTG